jgi:nucleoporin GLE1
LHAYHKRQQQEELDAREAAQAHVHRLELNAANAQHEVVRIQAEAVLQAYIKNEEEQRRRRLEEEQRRLDEEERRRRAEEEARRRAEEERRAREEKKRRDEEARAKEARAKEEAEQRAKEEAEAAEKDQLEKEAAARRHQEEKARVDQAATLQKQQEEEAAAAAAKSVPALQPSTSQSTPGQTHSPSPAIEKRHNEYLALHKKLKTFRSEFWTSTRTNPALKPHVGDMRRAMRTSVGQLTDDKVANRIAVRRIIGTSMQGLFVN